MKADSEPDWGNPVRKKNFPCDYLGWFWFCYHSSLTKELQNESQNLKLSPGKLRQRPSWCPAGRPCWMPQVPPAPQWWVSSSWWVLCWVCFSDESPVPHKIVLGATLAFCRLGEDQSTCRPGGISSLKKPSRKLAWTGSGVYVWWKSSSAQQGKQGQPLEEVKPSPQSLNNYCHLYLDDTQRK